MRLLAGLLLTVALGCPTAFAQEQGGDKAKGGADHQRMKEQAEALKKLKTQEGENAIKNTKRAAADKQQAVDEHLKQEHRMTETHGKVKTWLYGPKLMHHATQAQKLEQTKRAQEHKDRIAAEASRRAANQAHAAKKASEAVSQSVEGLQSQASKDGKFGLQQKGSNLHVRKYGHN